MNILFWNTGSSQANPAIVDLIKDTTASIICLAEYYSDPKELLRLIHLCGFTDFHIVPQIACTRLIIISNQPLNSIKHKRDDDRYTIKELQASGFPPLLIAFVHLPSKLHHDEDDQLLRATQIREEIERIESEIGHENTIIIGDFNMNPFDKGMISAAGFNSLPCSTTANRITRKIGNKKYKFFYNPSWNLLGDLEKSPGTYFHRNPGSLSHYWNTLDQVLVRPALAPIFDSSSLKALRQAGSSNLLKEDKTPGLSDHLPISFTINNP